MGLRTWLVLLVVSVLVPLTLLSMWQIQTRMKLYAADSLQDEMDYAEAVETAFTAYLNEIWTSELVLGISIARSGATIVPATVEQLLKQAAPDYPNAEFLTWLGPDGAVVASTDPDTANLMLAHRDYVQSASLGQSRVVSDLVVSHVTNVPTIMVGRAIRVGGRLLGMMVVGEDARRFAAILPPSWRSDRSFGLVDPQGTLVYRSDAPALPMSQRHLAGSNIAVSALRGVPLVKKRYLASDGSIRMGAAVPVPAIGWSVFASTPISKIQAEARRESANAALALLLVASGSILAAVLISNRALHRMRRLRRAADALARGDRTARVGLDDGDEVGQTAQTFDQMADRIQATEEQLRRRAAQQAVVATLGQLALAGADISALVNSAVAFAAHTLNVESALVAEFCANTATLVVRARFGLPQGGSALLTIAVGPDSFASLVLASKAPQIRNVAAETQFESSAGPFCLRSSGTMGVPIFGRGGAYGILKLHSAGNHAFTSEDAHFAQAVANVIATAIERRRVEDDLTDSREHFRALVEASPVPIITTDGGLITAWNRAAERIFGWKAAEVLGRPMPGIRKSVV